MEAVDVDEGENARITYAIYHVSNNGGNKFNIDPATGVICKLGTLCEFKISFSNQYLIIQNRIEKQT